MSHSQTIHALSLLRRTAVAIASANGPISAGAGSAALEACAIIVRDLDRPIAAKTLEAIVALFEALRDDITA